MTYKTGEAAAATLIKAISSGSVWTANNCISLSNDTTNAGASMVNSGLSDRYCFLSPAPFESGYEGIGDKLSIDVWQTLITLVVFAGTASGESPESLLTGLRQDIMTALDSRFTLSGSASRAKVVKGSEIQNFTTENQTPFILQEMTLLWEEERDFTQSD